MLPPVLPQVPTSSTQSVTVVDTTPAVLTLPPDVTVEAAGPDTTVALGAATATDVVDPSPAIASDAPATFPLGTTTVSCAAIDGHGNTSAGGFVVRVTDDPTPGRILGGGRVDQNGVRYTLDLQVTEQANGDVRGRFRLAVCSPGRDRESDDDDRDEDERCGGDGADDERSAGGGRNRFDAGGFTFVRFSDDPSFAPGRGPRQQALPDTLAAAGTGRWERLDGYLFEAVVTDRGEPGRGVDTVEVVITAPDGTEVIRVAGVLRGGNVQAAPLAGRGDGDRGEGNEDEGGRADRDENERNDRDR